MKSNGSNTEKPSQCLLAVAGEGGPRETLSAMSDGESCVIAAPTEAQAHNLHWWAEKLSSTQYIGLIVGTSDSDSGRVVEALGMRAAVYHDKSVFVIEDYPGNYNADYASLTTELSVESHSVATWYQERLGRDCPNIIVWPSPRYEFHRNWYNNHKSQNISDLNPSLHVLWVGQPETVDNLISLEILIPALERLGVSLHFKAHPRDSGYPHSYLHLLDDSAIGICDVTRYGVNEVLSNAPSLVITQFSSVAIEAGFYGIPALHVLLSNAGGKRLMDKKGYAIPFSVRAAASEVLTDPSEADVLLKNLIYNKRYRANIGLNFESYYCVPGQTARGLTDRWIMLAQSYQ